MSAEAPEGQRVMFDGMSGLERFCHLPGLPICHAQEMSTEAPEGQRLMFDGMLGLERFCHLP